MCGLSIRALGPRNFMKSSSRGAVGFSTLPWLKYLQGRSHKTMACPTIAKLLLLVVMAPAAAMAHEPITTNLTWKPLVDKLGQIRS